MIILAYHFKQLKNNVGGLYLKKRVYVPSIAFSSKINLFHKKYPETYAICKFFYVFYMANDKKFCNDTTIEAISKSQIILKNELGDGRKLF